MLSRIGLTTSNRGLRLFSSHSKTLASIPKTSTKIQKNLNSNSVQESGINWDEFLTLRKQQRGLNFTSSIATAVLGSALSFAYIAQIEIDPTQMIFGFDPLVIFTIGFSSCTGLCYLLGPTLGSIVFKMKNKKILNEFNKKNKTFLNHIINNRVDASRQSFANPVPDYYGEKIYSLKDYRQWLRDCNTYKRKAKEFV
ncbi:Pam17p [Ascoidea rubescens DSM 1968]|uniref:Presequence translocated-associated motor subunit PAM17 n=1 Tax=Ascoidea rubescens DSM 1968 TaxID=1344418 RepID=A0A1D2VHN5_9ASCO|nr:mitochondrial import protein Pam17 [Ascoidea rubescens DSM 1968]ODV61181.1 mitochondrial import protein Pam17 [Ascoidea rubescens DSM 1968]